MRIAKGKELLRPPNDYLFLSSHKRLRFNLSIVMSKLAKAAKGQTGVAGSKLLGEKRQSSSNQSDSNQSDSNQSDSNQSVF